MRISLVSLARRLAPAVILAAGVVGTLPAAAQEAPSLPQLRGTRAVLVQRIAGLTDRSVRAQQQAVEAARRVDAAAAAVEDVRVRVARFAVGAYVDGLKADEMTQLRRKGWADIASNADRRLLAALRSAQVVARQERRAADDAVAEARSITERVQFFRAQLEQLITERETADRAAAEARRLATASISLPARPRYARTTRSQAELFARYPFGPVASLPAGLAPTGQVVAGPASWYGPGFDGRPTASGAIFDQEGPTVAHRTLPLGTILLIRYGDRAVLALVNDRGPYVGGRVLDLSHGVAAALGTLRSGVARVSAEVVVPTA